MNKIFKCALLIAVCSAVLIGCMTPSRSQLATADYGTYPTNYEQTVKNYFENVLKDPDSARYRFGSVQKGWSSDGLLGGGKKWYGYIVEVNGFGGYTGWESYRLLISPGDIVTPLSDIDFQMPAMAGYVK